MAVAWYDPGAEGPEEGLKPIVRIDWLAEEADDEHSFVVPEDFDRRSAIETARGEQANSYYDTEAGEPVWIIEEKEYPDEHPFRRIRAIEERLGGPDRDYDSSISDRVEDLEERVARLEE